MNNYLSNNWSFKLYCTLLIFQNRKSNLWASFHLWFLSAFESFRMTWNSRWNSAASLKLYTNTHFLLYGGKKKGTKTSCTSNPIQSAPRVPPGSSGPWHISNSAATAPLNWAQRPMVCASSNDESHGTGGTSALSARTHFANNKVSASAKKEEVAVGGANQPFRFLQEQFQTFSELLKPI